MVTVPSSETVFRRAAMTFILLMALLTVLFSVACSNDNNNSNCTDGQYWRFQPKPDITAYELALILEITRPGYTGLTDRICVQNYGITINDFEELKRHFVKD